jgi:recombinational DNA repair protein (RecF pathway)
VRRGKSKIAGKLEFGAEAFLLLHQGRNLDVIAGAETLQSRWNTITRPAAYAAAHVMIELVDAFCERDFSMPKVYVLLNAALGALDGACDPVQLIPRFEVRLLAALGLAPYDTGCVQCGLIFEGEAAWADVDAGGLACRACRSQGTDALALEPHEVRNFQLLGAARAPGVRAAVTAVPAAARAIEAFLTYHLGRRPKAACFLSANISARDHSRP